MREGAGVSAKGGWTGKGRGKRGGGERGWTWQSWSREGGEQQLFCLSVSHHVRTPDVLRGDRTALVTGGRATSGLATEVRCEVPMGERTALVTWERATSGLSSRLTLLPDLPSLGTTSVGTSEVASAAPQAERGTTKGERERGSRERRQDVCASIGRGCIPTCNVQCAVCAARRDSDQLSNSPPGCPCATSLVLPPPSRSPHNSEQPQLWSLCSTVVGGTSHSQLLLPTPTLTAVCGRRSPVSRSLWRGPRGGGRRGARGRERRGGGPSGRPRLLLGRRLW